MDIEKKQVMKALVTFCVEKVLSDIGKPVLEKVTNRLYKEYQCYIPDCYDNPEYLEAVLKSVFGNSHIAIVESIRQELSEYMHEEAIQRLVKTIGR